MKFRSVRRPRGALEIQPEPTRVVFTPTCYPSVAAALWSDWWVVGDDLRAVCGDKQPPRVSAEGATRGRTVGDD